MTIATDELTAMTDLDKLIEAVEAGACGEEVLAIARSVPLLQYRIGKRDDAHDVWLAHAASDLNAAKRLHDALLPGWGWMMGDKGTVTVIPPERLFAETGIVGPTCRVSGNPARAWLLAVLRAVRAQRQATLTAP